jgi:hypothetical protein
LQKKKYAHAYHEILKRRDGHPVVEQLVCIVSELVACRHGRLAKVNLMSGAKSGVFQLALAKRTFVCL